MSRPAGHCYWLTGLAGAGKTTVGRALREVLHDEGRAAVYLDGDELREVLPPAGYSLDGRRELATRYARLARLLAGQGVDVIVATISNFPEVWAWNRAHIPGYREVWLRVSREVLEARDQKGLWSRARRGEVTEVVGADLPFVEPDAHLVVDNDGGRPPELIARDIYDHFSS